ncbi:hypothetical protein CSIV_05030 [Microbacterium sp. CSI-V]|uniref:hypothetical protein n=1 Tax=Microbacterium sp. CSI-V TaxID=1933777 RepID=UPI00097CBE6A|nr:hypothetical protein [Microbacterium sp. CSI-V]ONI65644.1 hypothetical protein CSIV_05030 [Microbacterium sp. CSI-V]
MKPQTKERLTAIASEISTEVFMAKKAKSPQAHFNRIHSLAREACDYFAFGFDAPVAPAPTEPEVFGFTCPVERCWWNDSETEQPDYATMREALDAADAHRMEHHGGRSGIVTTESSVPSSGGTS